MSFFNPRRTFLILPAWCWAAFCFIFVLIAWAIGPATHLDEPPIADRIFGSRIFVTRDGDNFRVVPASEAATTVPVWAIGRNMVVQTSMSYSKVLPVVPDFYHQSSEFTYALAGVAHGEHWKPEARNPSKLSRRDLRRVNAVVIAELNNRFPQEKLGDQLTTLLAEGTSSQSWWSPQNCLTAFALFSMAIAVAAMISMFVPVRKSASKPNTEPVESPEIAIVS